MNGSQIGKGHWRQEDAGDTLGETYSPAHSAKIPQDGIVVEIRDKYSQIDVIPHTNGGTNPTPGPALAQSSLIPITVLQPTPTPPPTKTTYTNPAFGYSIEHPYDWTVSKEGEKTLIQEPDSNAAYIEIERYSITRDQSTGDLADQYMSGVLAQAPDWEHVVVEWDIIGNKNRSGRYIGLNFSCKKPDFTCIQAGQTHSFRSKHAPKELVGYALTMASCQGSQQPPAEQFQTYLESFKE